MSSFECPNCGTINIDTENGYTVGCSCDYAQTSQRGDILKKALAIINGERQNQYGSPEDSFELIASFWDTYITTKLKSLDPEKYIIITPKDVAILMSLLKIARESHQHKSDNLIDIAGYIGLAGDLDEAS